MIFKIKSAEEEEVMVTPFTEYMIQRVNQSISLDEKDINIIKENNEIVILKIPKNLKKDNGFFAMKIFKLVDFQKDFEIKFKRFLREVSIMARVKHVATVELVGWSISRIFDDNKKFKPKCEEFQPSILMPYYQHLKDIYITHIRNNITNSAIFFYGCLRAYSYIHSLDYIMRNINIDNFLFEQKGKYYYPKISNFNTFKNQDAEKSHLDKSSISILQNLENYSKKYDVLSFGLIIYKLTESNKELNSYNYYCNDANFFKPLIVNMVIDSPQRVDFHTACIIFEKEIIPRIEKSNTDFDSQVFNDYVREINEYEGENYGYTQIDNFYENTNFISYDNENKYEYARKILRSANKGDPKAAFLSAIYYYSGNLLPKDLTRCFLYLKICCRGNFNTIADSFRRSLISIMNKKRKIGKEEEEQYDEEALFYRGSFYESPKVSGINGKKFLEENFSFLLMSTYINQKQKAIFDPKIHENINESVNCYMKSLDIKKTPAAYGRLGAILTNYTKNDYGPTLLKIANDQEDIYGMVKYGLHLFYDKKDYEGAKEVFTNLYEKDYLDAASSLGTIYKIEGNEAKAKKYFAIAKKKYAADNIE